MGKPLRGLARQRKVAWSALAVSLVAFATSLTTTARLGDAFTAGQGSELRRFIVAFELRTDKREEFVWPHPSFARANYGQVLLVVNEMPTVHVPGKSDRLEVLSAAKHLRINGRLREPRQSDSTFPPSGQAPAGEEFVVELEAGRVRLALVLPRDVEVDASHRRARITLYEFEGRRTPSLESQTGAHGR